jgi:hypothetical protein
MEGELVFKCTKTYWGGEYEESYTVQVESVIVEGGEVSFIGIDSNGQKKDFNLKPIARKYEFSSSSAD